MSERAIDWQPDAPLIVERRDFDLNLTELPFQAGDTMVSYAKRLVDALGEDWTITDVRGECDRLNCTEYADHPRQAYVFGAERLIVCAERVRRLDKP